MTEEELLSDEQARQVLRRIDQMYPHAHSQLHWDNNFHLLCAVLMSAQTTDKMVNRIMPQFEKDFPTPLSLSQSSLYHIEKDIHQIGLYRTKAKHLQGTASILVKKYHSHVPSNKKALLAMPGVGEKVANVVLAEGFGIPAIAVDRHVARIAKKFKIVSAKASPHQVEKRLEELLPQNEWIHTHHAMIFFGRYRMPARAKNKDPYFYLK